MIIIVIIIIINSCQQMLQFLYTEICDQKKKSWEYFKIQRLVTEIQRTCNVKAKVIPVITGATGTISESLREYLSNVPGKHEIKELQKTAILCSCTQTAGSANVKAQDIFHRRNNITCSTDCKYRRAATLYTLETWFVSGM